MSVTVKLLPYEILAGKATSYADVSLTISNASQKNIQIKVSQIEIVTDDTKKLLMSLTPRSLRLPHKISLQPGETKILQYRLESKSQLYQRGQDVIAQIRYRQDTQTQQVIQSSPETVAFMIP